MIDINQAAVVTGVGIDYRQGQVIYTTQFAQRASLLDKGTAEPLTENITSQGKTVTEAARSVLLIAPEFPLWAHADVIMIGENLARDNLDILTDFLARNRNLRPEISLLLAYQETPEKLLNVPVPLSPHSGTAINQLLENNESLEGVHVKVITKDFLSHLITPGIDPVLPQISLSENNNLYLSGMAVFKGRRMVGSLNEQESRGYRWLNYKANQGGTLTVYSPIDKKALTFMITNISNKIRPLFKDDQLQCRIEVNTSLNLLEQTGEGNLMTGPRRRQMEQLANKEIKRQIESCIDKAQSLHSDILGLGLMTYRYYPEYWQEVQDDWYKIYPHLQTQIKVESRLAGGYLLNHSADLEN
jgi:Ger(x)C family germination protein